MSFDQIPHELRQYRQFVSWNYEYRSGTKPTKVPFNPSSGHHASVTNPDTWVSFDLARLYQNAYSGLGFVLTPEDPYCFIDLDETVDPEEIALQQEIFKRFATYAELSPSGKGLHLICKGSVPFGCRSKSIEIYSEKRYMTMTGQVYNDVAIRDCQADVTSLFEFFEARKGIPMLPFSDVETKSDREIWDMAVNARNGDKFQRLWNGDFETDYHGDQSRADFALIDMLGFYSDARTQVKRMFRLSGLGQRPKAQRENYVDVMIDRSFDKKVPLIDFSKVLPDPRTSILLAEQPPLATEIETFEDISLEDKLKMEMNARPRTIDEGVFSVPPGLMGKIAKFIYDQSYKPVPEIAITGAIAYMAGLCGRAYNVNNSGLNVYLLLLAGTGRGKDAIAEGIAKLTASVAHLMPTLTDFIGPGQLASGQALIKYLHDHRTRSFVSVFGEFGITLKTLANSKNPNDYNLQRVILDLFGKSGANGLLQGSAYADSSKNLPNIQSPAFSFVGESVPDRFYSSIDEAMITTGLLPRFTVVEYLGLRPPTNYDHAFAVPSLELSQALCTLATQVYSHLNLKKPCIVEYTPEATELDRALDIQTDKIINSRRSPLNDELWNRVHLRTRRLAALLAVGVNPIKPVIDVTCWRWAEDFIVNAVEKLSNRFENGQIGLCSAEANQLAVVRSWLKHYLTMTKKEVDALKINPDLQAKKVVLHTTLSKKTQRERPFFEDFYGANAALKKVIGIMIDNGELSEVPRIQMSSEFSSTAKGYFVTNLV